MKRKYFGTDGIRGRVGDSVMTPEFVLKLGWAAGKVLCNASNNLVLIGKDTRISGYMLESVLEAGLSAAGANSRLLGPMPTPGIAYLTSSLRASAGIVICASHNPDYDNGVKICSTDGTKLADEVELQIEAAMEKPLTTVSSDHLGKVERVVDAAGAGVRERGHVVNAAVLIAVHLRTELFGDVTQRIAQPAALSPPFAARAQAGSRIPRAPFTGCFF